MANGRMLWALVFTIFALSVVKGSKREVETELYPDCRSYTGCQNAINQNATVANASFPNVAYVRSVAGNDVLHFVMTTVNLPSILVVHTVGDEKQRLNFNWTRLLRENTTDLKGAVYTNQSLYHGQIQYSFALTFSRLIEYDDVDDSANLENAEKNTKVQWNYRNFTEFQWMNVTKGQGGKSIIFNTTEPQPAPYVNTSAGSMYFEFEINSNDGRDDDLPRLIYNANNTQMNFVLDKYVPMFNKSRFALEMTIVANHSSKKMSVEETKSIDDEYSPGVFRVVNWFSAGKSNTGGYIQWKPVCYLAADRSRGVGTEVMRYELTNTSTMPQVADLLGESLAQAFFGGALSNTSKVVQMSANISFGLSQDGYYLKNNYTAWTASVGYGQAPEEGISTLVIIIIAAGLGIPVIIIIFGGIFVCVKRRRRNSDYEDLDRNVSRNNPQLN